MNTLYLPKDMGGWKKEKICTESAQKSLTDDVITVFVITHKMFVI